MVLEPGLEQVWVVCALLKLDRDGRGIDRDNRSGVYEVAEDAPRLRSRIFLSEFGPKEPLEAARHERELEVTVDLHGDR